MKDIARDLGVSPMTVSKALRDHKDIAEKTKARVRKRAAELNYRMDSVARSMVTGRTYLVGLVVPDLMQTFFTELATALTSVLAPAGYHILISHSSENAKEEIANIDLLVTRRVDGLIIASAQRSPKYLEALETPFILVDRQVPGLEADYVGSQNDDVGYLATHHLIEQGCRRIAHLRGPMLSSATGRLRGYRRALTEQGMEIQDAMVIDAGHEDDSGYLAMRRLLSSGPPPDGVFCFNDPVAVGAMKGLMEAGFSIPADVAIIGAANMHYSDMLRVPLSTVDQNIWATGQQAGRLLLERMRVERRAAARQLILPPRLLIRASSRRAASEE